MARTFAPEDFGAVALALLFVESASIFVALGMGAAIIHSDRDRHKIIFHAFVISAISSVILTLFGLANSAWLASVLGDPSIEPLLQVLLLNLVLGALIIVPSAMLKKDLAFAAIYKSNIVSRLMYLAVAIILGMLGVGVWSLVIANLTSSIVQVIVLWWSAPNRDWLKPVPWDWNIARGLLNYGIRVTGSNVVSFFGSNVDDWLVGRRLGTYSLGLYTKAYDFTTHQINALGISVVGGVFFPAYTTIRDNTERLKRAYLKSIRLISMIMFPLGLGFLATAPILIPVVLGEKWIPMTLTFQMFSILILTRPVSANTSSVYQAVGKPQYNMYAGLVLTAVMVPMVLLLIDRGIAAVAVAVLIADTVALLFNIVLTNRVLPGTARKTLGASLPSLLAGLIMFVFVYFSLEYFVTTLGENVWSLSAAIVVGIVVYTVAIFLIQREFTIEVIQTLVKAFDKNGRLARLLPKRGGS